MMNPERVWYISFYNAPKDKGYVDYASYAMYDEDPQTGRKRCIGAHGMLGISQHPEGMHLQLADLLIHESQKNPDLKFTVNADTPPWLIEEFYRYLAKPRKGKH